MTYQIYYSDDLVKDTRKVMFDIEYYLRESERNEEKYFSEIHCVPIVNGLTYFLKDKFKQEEDFDYESFIKDAKEIQEIRGFLFEKCDNKPREHKEAREYHSKFNKQIYEILSDFALKYNLYINID